MNEKQKLACRELLRLSYANGFDSAYPLASIATQLGSTTQELYNGNTETGLLFEFGEKGNALLWFTNSGDAAGVCVETKDLLEAWSR